MNAGTKWLISILVISLALNVFVFGYFIGKTPAQITIGQATTPIMQEPEIKSAFKSLPAENRQLILELKKKEQEEIVVNLAQIRQLRLQMSAVIQQEPLDQQKLTELFEKIYQLSCKNESLAQQGIYQTIILLPQSERVKIAKLLILKSTQAPQKPTQNPVDKSS